MYSCTTPASLNGSMVESKAEGVGVYYTLRVGHDCGHISPHGAHTLLHGLLEIKLKTMKGGDFRLYLPFSL